MYIKQDAWQRINKNKHDQLRNGDPNKRSIFRGAEGGVENPGGAGLVQGL